MLLCKKSVKKLESDSKMAKSSGLDSLNAFNAVSEGAKNVKFPFATFLLKAGIMSIIEFKMLKSELDWMRSNTAGAVTFNWTLIDAMLKNDRVMIDN